MDGPSRRGAGSVPVSGPTSTGRSNLGVTGSLAPGGAAEGDRVGFAFSQRAACTTGASGGGGVWAGSHADRWAGEDGPTHAGEDRPKQARRQACHAAAGRRKQPIRGLHMRSMRCPPALDDYIGCAECPSLSFRSDSSGVAVVPRRRLTIMRRVGPEHAVPSGVDRASRSGYTKRRRRVKGSRPSQRCTSVPPTRLRKMGRGLIFRSQLSDNRRMGEGADARTSSVRPLSESIR